MTIESLTRDKQIIVSGWDCQSGFRLNALPRPLAFANNGLHNEVESAASGCWPGEYQPGVGPD